jgi:hypothetical protein
MSNEIAKPEKDFFGQFANTVLGARFIGDLLTFNKFGEFAAGREKAPIALGTRLVAHMTTLEVGWVRWESNRPAEQLMGRVADGFRPAKRHELGFVDKSTWECDDEGTARDPWQLANQLVLSDLRTRQLYTYTTSSRGGFSAIGELAKAYSDHNRQTPDQYPVVELARSSYRHSNPAFGEIRIPQFKIASWISREGPDGLLGTDSATASSVDTAENQLPPPAESVATSKATPKAESVAATKAAPKVKAGKRTQPASPRI